jgi:hypothetical protein
VTFTAERSPSGAMPFETIDTKLIAVHIRADSAQCGEASVKRDHHALPDRCVAESDIGVETRATVTDDQHVVRVIMTSVPLG